MTNQTSTSHGCDLPSDTNTNSSDATNHGRPHRRCLCCHDEESPTRGMQVICHKDWHHLPQPWADLAHPPSFVWFFAMAFRPPQLHRFLQSSWQRYVSWVHRHWNKIVLLDTLVERGWYWIAPPSFLSSTTTTTTTLSQQKLPPQPQQPEQAPSFVDGTRRLWSHQQKQQQRSPASRLLWTSQLLWALWQLHRLALDLAAASSGATPTPRVTTTTNTTSLGRRIRHSRTKVGDQVEDPDDHHQDNELHVSSSSSSTLDMTFCLQLALSMIHSLWPLLTSASAAVVVSAPGTHDGDTNGMTSSDTARAIMMVAWRRRRFWERIKFGLRVGLLWQIWKWYWRYLRRRRRHLSSIHDDDDDGHLSHNPCQTMIPELFLRDGGCWRPRWTPPSSTSASTSYSTLSVSSSCAMAPPIDRAATNTSSAWSSPFGLRLPKPPPEDESRHCHTNTEELEKMEEEEVYVGRRSGQQWPPRLRRRWSKPHNGSDPASNHSLLLASRPLLSSVAPPVIIHGNPPERMHSPIRNFLLMCLSELLYIVRPLLWAESHGSLGTMIALHHDDGDNHDDGDGPHLEHHSSCDANDDRSLDGHHQQRRRHDSSASFRKRIPTMTASWKVWSLSLGLDLFSLVASFWATQRRLTLGSTSTAVRYSTRRHHGGVFADASRTHQNGDDEDDDENHKIQDDEWLRRYQRLWLYWLRTPVWEGLTHPVLTWSKSLLEDYLPPLVGPWFSSYLLEWIWWWKEYRLEEG